MTEQLSLHFTSVTEFSSLKETQVQFLGNLDNLISPLSLIFSAFTYYSVFPGGSDGKVSVYNAGDLGLIPGLGRFPGEGNGNPLQDYCLENPMDRGAW